MPAGTNGGRVGGGGEGWRSAGALKWSSAMDLGRDLRCKRWNHEEGRKALIDSSSGKQFLVSRRGRGRGRLGLRFLLPCCFCC
ncbi:hypothetical protein MRB53_025217 [Persea americana]|uniref:Uncharacterized protein n=1 Tax=Persea americana TaxID=3435 RepID=A0ACC2LF81_PERAE|nr:hypothetical protein MRB53_025217 [Persea americana]